MPRLDLEAWRQYDEITRHTRARDGRAIAAVLQLWVNTTRVSYVHPKAVGDALVVLPVASGIRLCNGHPQAGVVAWLYIHGVDNPVLWLENPGVADYGWLVPMDSALRWQETKNDVHTSGVYIRAAAQELRARMRARALPSVRPTVREWIDQGAPMNTVRRRAVR